MKRICCLGLIAILLLAVIPALADNVRTSGLYTYKIKGNGTITITDFDWKSNNGDVYIPNMIDGYNLTAIEEGAFAEEEYKKDRTPCIVTLPNGITMIGAKAFMNASVSAINIPASTQFIGAGAFANCPLKQFSVAPDNAVYATINGVLYNKTTKTLVAYPRDAGRIDIPEGIVRIEAYAFYGTSLGDSSVAVYGSDNGWGIGDMLPSSIVEIGDYAFAESKLSVYSKKLENDTECIFLPKNVTKIGEYAFANSSLSYLRNPMFKSICLGNNGASIGKGAFQGATIRGEHLDSVAICGHTIGDDAFNNLKFSEASNPIVKLTEGIDTIGFRSFANITNDIYIPSECEISLIGEEAFASSSVFMEAEIDMLHNVWIVRKRREESSFTFPAGDSTIRKNVFNAGLESRYANHLIIPSGVICIEESAFANNQNLKTVEFPMTLTTIETRAFENTSIASVRLPMSVTKIGEAAFDRTDATLIVEKGSYSALWAQENGYSYKYVGEENDTSWLNGFSDGSSTEDTSWLNN